MSPSTATSRADHESWTNASRRRCAPCSTRSEAARSRASSLPTTRRGDRSSRSCAGRTQVAGSSRSDRSSARSRARKACSARTCMASVDVPVALLGYGTVGAAVNRLLIESADEIERATGHRLRVTRALVRDMDKERDYPAGDGVLTTDFQSLLGNDSIALVAEVMGGVEPTGGYVLDLLRAGKPVVSANKQLLARRSADLFAAASEGGVQLRFEASVCAAIPVIKVLRESLVVTNVHRVLGIVNGTTNFILTRMEEGAEYEEALAEAQRLGYAEADPTDDVSGADAAAKMAVLATVAFGSRVELVDVAYEGIEGIKPHHVEAA